MPWRVGVTLPYPYLLPVSMSAYHWLGNGSVRLYGSMSDAEKAQRGMLLQDDEICHESVKPGAMETAL